jgi:ABC-type protease/lipase transport system fused ATPase/permease subunit
LDFYCALFPFLFRDKYSAIDGYRNEVVLNTKKVVQNVVKATGLTKSIAERWKKQEMNDVSFTNTNQKTFYMLLDLSLSRLFC